MALILRKHFWVFNLVVIAVCATLLGHAAASLLVQTVVPAEGANARRQAPVPFPADRARLDKDPAAILSRNIFCSTCAKVSPSMDRPQDGPADRGPRKSSLQLQLVATMVSRETHWSLGVVRDVADERRRVAPYRRGDALPQGAIVAQVVDRRMYIVVGGQVEYIDQDDTPPPGPPPGVADPPRPGPIVAQTGLEGDIDKGVRCSGGNCEVDRGLVNKLLANTTTLATTAQFYPWIQDGRPGGFKIAAIRPGSIFAKLGMANGDVIKAINGLEMTTPEKILEAYTKLRSASHLTAQLERNAGSVTLDYQIRG